MRSLVYSEALFRVDLVGTCSCLFTQTVNVIMAKVLVLGSSHINKFENFVRKTHSANSYCLDYPRISVFYCGISGGRILNQAHTERLEGAIRTFQPDKIIFQIGGNDLDSANSSDEYTVQVVNKVIEYSGTYVHKFGMTSVALCQFLPRYDTRKCIVDTYNKRVISANIHLKETLQSDKNIHYWKLKGLKDIEHFEDGVQLSELAQHKYYRNIRGANIHNF